MTTVIVALWLAAAPKAAPLPDISAPLGRLSDILVMPSGGVPGSEKIIETPLASCDHKVPINVTHFVAGATYAVQQLAEWMAKTKGLEESLFARKGVLGELVSGVARSKAGELHVCSPLGKSVAKAPKLCPGERDGEAWLMVDKVPVALVSWVDTKDCLPKITAVLFDTKGVARFVYAADFGAAVEATVLGDKCANVELKLDADKQVFHAERRGC